ncbi:hypothetical protein ACEWY4_011258 [Coilia grayii]|uniref:Ankyrin repeat, SAM and basic leucine zipper domain-containing protein 1 n=1 Tax=Coilia grayii TaxID=363190 RepID=A0ABD1K4I2_9TELE
MEVETRLGFEWTPLMCAVYAGNYDMAKLLLDRGASANFSKDLYTVLMAACTAAVPEDKIIKCVELLLSRNADSNASNKSHMTSLMMAARQGHSQVISLLVSNGAEINSQDAGGHTALMIAVQYGRDEAVLKLLQLGADKTLKTVGGKTAADFAKQYRQPQITRFLASQNGVDLNGDESSKQDNLFKFFNRSVDPSPASLDSSAKLCDIELLLHGLNLEHLAEVIIEHDVTWGELLTMERQDLEKIGITNREDLMKLLSAVQEMHLDHVDLNTLTQLENIDNGSEELFTFLISLRQQCCYLTDTVRDVIGRFPRSASELVLTWDPKKEARGICTELVAQTEDLQKEVSCLSDLLCKCIYSVGRVGVWVWERERGFVGLRRWARVDAKWMRGAPDSSRLSQPITQVETLRHCSLPGSERSEAHRKEKRGEGKDGGFELGLNVASAPQLEMCDSAGSAKRLFMRRVFSPPERAQMDPAESPGQPARPSSHGHPRRWLPKTLALGMLGAGLLLLLVSQTRRSVKMWA